MNAATLHPYIRLSISGGLWFYVLFSTLPLVVILFPPLLMLFQHPPSLLIVTGWHGWGLLGYTLLLGLSTSLTTLALGTPIGFLLARTDLPGRTLLRVVFVLPLFLPPYVQALAWQGLLGGLCSGFVGTLLTLTVAFLPLPLLFVEAALAGIPAQVEEAGLVHVGLVSTLRGITFPLLWPALFAAGTLVFLLAAGEFGVPLLLGYRVFPVEVYTRFAAFYDFAGAALASLPLVGLAFLILWGERAFLGRLTVSPASSRTQRSPVRLMLERWRWPLFLFLGLLALASVLVPQGMLFARSLSPGAYRLALTLAGPALLNSVVLSVLGATLLCALAFLLSYARERLAVSALLTSAVPLVLFAVPGPVVGIALIGLWNRPALSWVYGSSLIILLAWMARYTVLPTWILRGSLAQVSSSLEEAGLVSGISWGRVQRGITLPLVRTGFLVSWLTALIFCLRDLETVVTVYPPGRETLMVRLFTVMANSPAAVVAALATLQVLLILLPVAALLWVWSRRGGQGRW